MSDDRLSFIMETLYPERPSLYQYGALIIPCSTPFFLYNPVFTSYHQPSHMDQMQSNIILLTRYSLFMVTFVRLSVIIQICCCDLNTAVEFKSSVFPSPTQTGGHYVVWSRPSVFLVRHYYHRSRHPPIRRTNGRSPLTFAFIWTKLENVGNMNKIYANKIIKC